MKTKMFTPALTPALPMNLPAVERGSVTRSGPGLAEMLRVTDPRSGSAAQIADPGGSWNLFPGERENGFPRLGKFMTAFCSALLRFCEDTQRLFPLPRGEGRGENCPNAVSRFEPLNHPLYSNGKMQGAFLPLRVGGAGGADGERVGVRCAFHHLGVHGEVKRDGRINGLLFRLGAFAVIGAGVMFATPSVSAQTNASAVAKLAPVNQRYKIGVCDWMILKRQKLNAFPLAKEIGVDGVEVDMGQLGQRATFENRLTNAAEAQVFLDKAHELNLEIPSMAMSGFYAQSFAERPTVPLMVSNCIATMQLMKVKIVFLPLGVCDLVQFPELRPLIVERLKAAGKQAEAAGIVIGVETSLPAAEEVKLLDEIGSPAIKSYFNFSNAIQNHRNLITELRTLGADRIVQIHCTNGDTHWLQNDPDLDFPKIKQTLDDMGWSGWLIIERGRERDPKDIQNIKLNFSSNAAYLKSIFQKP